MKDWNNYLGKTYGNIRILDTYQRKIGKRNRRLFLCECLLCHTKFETAASDVLRTDDRRVQSCGCLQKEKVSSLGCRTGKTNIRYAVNNHYQKWEHKTCDGKGRPTPLYIAYRDMVSRCTNPKDKYYHLYGGKGIKVCQEWLKNWDAYYEWAMMNGYKEHYEAHRLDTNGDYCPENLMFLSDNLHNAITLFMRKNNLCYISKSKIESYIEHHVLDTPEKKI